MNRKLLVIHPDHCMEVQFDQQITIGRDVFNSLSLQDAEVSRSHAIIFEQDNQIIIKDLKSRNGTYVGGGGVTECTLEPGNEIILGTTVMIFDPTETLDLGVALSKRGRYLIEKRESKPKIGKHKSTTKFSLQEMSDAVNQLFMDPEHATFFTLENALVLLQAMREMNDAADSGQLFETTMRKALAVLGGHRGVIMETDEGREHLKVRSIISVDNSETLLIGQPILQIVLGSEKCVFCPNISRDSHFAGMAKKSGRPVYSFITVPILGRSELFGFIYIDSEDSSVSYDFPALRSLYFLGTHLGALLRARSTRFPKHASAIPFTPSQ
jgi:pSer/pThr/pTyr-binding forkhead associated (FHA) protein